MKYYIKVTCAFKWARKLPRKTETYESAKCVPCNTRKCTHNRFVRDLLKWALKCRFSATGPWAARNVFVKSLLTQWLLFFYYLYYSWCYIVLNSFCKLCTYFLKLNKVIISIIYNNNNNNNNNDNNIPLGTKGMENYFNKIPASLNIHELQKTTLLSTAHLLRWALSDQVETPFASQRPWFRLGCWERRSIAITLVYLI